MLNVPWNESAAHVSSACTVDMPGGVMYDVWRASSALAPFVHLLNLFPSVPHQTNPESNDQ